MSICNYCQWNDMTFDEIGAIDYCTQRKIYSDKMEFIEECYHFRPKPKEVLYEKII